MTRHQSARSGPYRGPARVLLKATSVQVGLSGAASRERGQLWPSLDGRGMVAAGQNDQKSVVVRTAGSPEAAKMEAEALLRAPVSLTSLHVACFLSLCLL